MRYFIVFYFYNISNSPISGHGHLAFNSPTYLNSQETKMQIENFLLNETDQYCHCVITNIIEINKQDYENWTK